MPSSEALKEQWMQADSGISGVKGMQMHLPVNAEESNLRNVGKRLLYDYVSDQKPHAIRD